jgi:hypothetical protein
MKPENYIIKCIVDDGNGGIDSAEVVVKVVQTINHDPVIEKIKASPRKIDLGKSSVIECFSSDPDNDILTFTWSSFVGTISGNDSSVTWTAPDIPGNYSIKCIS